MKKLVLVTGLVAALIGGVPFSAMAAKPAVETKVKGEIVEKTGTIEVKQAEKNEKYNTVTLKAGNDVFKLLPVKGNKTIMGDLEKLAGKEVTVKGELLPANEKHPMAAIKVESFTEKTAAAPAPAAAPADAPAADAPAPAPAAGN
ncbi:MAG TPA: hypothetical protein PLU72_13745 [Candidatus Ozemobacteraceae bacterium]|nr:hypothetical protein [Candidatus Ozemobacteraceae bacterium]